MPISNSKKEAQKKGITLFKPLTYLLLLVAFLIIIFPRTSSKPEVVIQKENKELQGAEGPEAKVLGIIDEGEGEPGDVVIEDVEPAKEEEDPVSIPQPTVQPQAEPVPEPFPTPASPPPPSNTGSYTCNCSKTCTQMSSCDEAYYQLNSCGCSKRDGDSDGVPCENICPGG